jgi:Tol biopolymer transport system component
MPQVSASATGTLVYNTGVSFGSSQLTWFDRQGNTLEKIGEPGAYFDLALSPDGSRLAVARRDQRTRNEDIWLLELDRGVSTRLTFNEALDRLPVWSPDGKRIVFASSRSGHLDLYMKASDGSGDDQLLLKTDQDKIPYSWSRDGRYLLYNTRDPKTSDIWVLPMDGDRKPFLFLRTEFRESEGTFSPDMHWIAYTSDESGQNEIYVRQFSPPGPRTLPAPEIPSRGKWQVSKNGGTLAWWRDDGKELIFLGRESLMSVEVGTNPRFHVGTPQPIFRLPGIFAQGVLQTIARTTDFKRFLLAVPAEESAQRPITVVLNWAAALNKK